jgi:hypothetical protein
MDRGVNILCVRGRYPMGRRLDIPWLEESSAMGRELKTMHRGVKIS